MVHKSQLTLADAAQLLYDDYATDKELTIFTTLGDNNTLDRITCSPTRMNGQPTIRGLRLTVKRLLQLLILYPNRDELRREYPEIEDEDIRQALLYAINRIED
ncbi:MAG TPA: DUF433 domain-containing protein [Caldilineaceae bacterium]|nr:DUF433 domain-containing protein [Caldilineaceae bacterium]